jgi:hypothetical protein
MELAKFEKDFNSLFTILSKFKADFLYLCDLDHLSMVEGRSVCPNRKAAEMNPLPAVGFTNLKHGK